MESLELAKERIKEYRNEKESKDKELESTDFLEEIDEGIDLSGLDLTSEDLKELIPELASLKIKDLNLTNNSLKTLPPEISQLTNLYGLVLEENKITELPNEIEHLENLMRLDLDSNLLISFPLQITNLENLYELKLGANALSSLPPEIGNLTGLNVLDVSYNDLRRLPNEIGNLIALEELNLTHNNIQRLPREIEGLTSLYHLDASENPLRGFPEISSQVAFTGEIDYTKFNNNLETLYGEQSHAIGKKIDGMENTLIKTPGSENEISTVELIDEFIDRLPENPLYHTAAKHILDDVLSAETSLDTKQTHFQQMAIAFGDCDTPVIDYLTQALIGMQKSVDGEIPDALKNLIEREAIENAIIKNDNNQKFLKDTEKIEQVQGLLNSVFLDNSEHLAGNKIPILGGRPRLPSKTVNTQFAFNMVTETAEREFTKLICKTDGDNMPIKQGKFYELDPKKYIGITEPYFASLGIVSEREKLVRNHRAKIEHLPKYRYIASEKYDEEGADKLLNMSAQELELRDKLLRTPDQEIKSTAENYFLEKTAAIEVYYKELGKKEVTASSNTQSRASAARPEGQPRKRSFLSELNNNNKRRRF